MSRSACSIVHSVSSAKHGSHIVRPGSSMPIDAVIADWCAPPSRDSETPDGVPAKMKRAPEYTE